MRQVLADISGIEMLQTAETLQWNIIRMVIISASERRFGLLRWTLSSLT